MDFTDLAAEIASLADELQHAERNKDGEDILKDIKAAAGAALTRLKMRKPAAKGKAKN